VSTKNLREVPLEKWGKVHDKNLLQVPGSMSYIEDVLNNERRGKGK
jgi:hypothetical protein